MLQFYCIRCADFIFNSLPQALIIYDNINIFFIIAACTSCYIHSEYDRSIVRLISFYNYFGITVFFNLNISLIILRIPSEYYNQIFKTLTYYIIIVFLYQFSNFVTTSQKCQILTHSIINLRRIAFFSNLMCSRTTRCLSTNPYIKKRKHILKITFVACFLVCAVKNIYGHYIRHWRFSSCIVLVNLIFLCITKWMPDSWSKGFILIAKKICTVLYYLFYFIGLLILKHFKYASYTIKINVVFCRRHKLCTLNICPTVIMVSLIPESSVCLSLFGPAYNTVCGFFVLFISIKLIRKIKTSCLY